jgi:hypothetical protein
MRCRHVATAAFAVAALSVPWLAAGQGPAGPGRDHSASRRAGDRSTRDTGRGDETGALAGPLRVRIVHTAPFAAAETGRRTARFWALLEIDAPTARAGAWLAGGSAEVTLRTGEAPTEVVEEVEIAPHIRSLLISLGEVTLTEDEYEVTVRARPALDGDALGASVRLPAIEGPGVPALFRRGPTTGKEFQPTARPLFRRFERVRVELPVERGVQLENATLVGRNGVAIAVPVRTESRVEHGLSWIVAEVSLAPLAPGEYAVRMTVTEAGDRRSVVVAGFRLVG